MKSLKTFVWEIRNLMGIETKKRKPLACVLQKKYPYFWLKMFSFFALGSKLCKIKKALKVKEKF